MMLSSSDAKCRQVGAGPLAFAFLKLIATRAGTSSLAMCRQILVAEGPLGLFRGAG
jgi:hypothetical protein